MSLAWVTVDLWPVAGHHLPLRRPLDCLAIVSEVLNDVTVPGEPS